MTAELMDNADAKRKQHVLIQNWWHLSAVSRGSRKNAPAIWSPGQVKDRTRKRLAVKLDDAVQEALIADAPRVVEAAPADKKVASRVPGLAAELPPPETTLPPED